jgi:hypothetical protein
MDTAGTKPMPVNHHCGRCREYEDNSGGCQGASAQARPCGRPLPCFEPTCLLAHIEMSDAGLRRLMDDLFPQSRRGILPRSSDTRQDAASTRVASGIAAPQAANEAGEGATQNMEVENRQGGVYPPTRRTVAHIAPPSHPAAGVEVAAGAEVSSSFASCPPAACLPASDRQADFFPPACLAQTGRAINNTWIS